MAFRLVNIFIKSIFRISTAMTVASCTRSSSTLLPSEVDYDLPLEMLCYFTREKLYTDENEILYNWAVAYNYGEE